MTDKKPKIYFNGLDGLRAIAAFAVVFHHIEFYKYRDGISSLFDFPFSKFFIFHIGENGVFLFFVLSGFLITYLLLDEKERFNKISLKKFYLRRICRIWPLYFTVFFVSFFLIPFLTQKLNYFSTSPYYHSQVINISNYSIKSFLLFVSLLPNVALLVYDKFIVGCSQLWSVGIEEQFYIFWPVLILLFNKKQIKWIFLSVILFFCLSDYSLNSYLKLVTRVFTFHYMAVGSLGAIVFKYYNKNAVMISKNIMLHLLMYILLICLLFFNITDEFYQKLFLAILFLCTILSVVSNQFSLLNNKAIVYLGKISYGIYMYHFLVMYLLIPFANRYLLNNLIVYNIVVYILVFSLTIIISHFSYKYFESYFLRIKEKKFN